MWDIAKAFGVTTDDLRRVNYLGTSSRLHIGQQIKLPSYANKLAADSSNDKPAANAVADPAPATIKPKSSKTTPSGPTTTYAVRSGDTIWDIARKFNMRPEEVRSLNGIGRSSRIHVGQKLVVLSDATADIVYYEIKSGDTIADIAQRYGTTISRIIADNPSADPRQLRIGDKIRISMQ